MGELTKAAVEEAIGGYTDPYLETDLVSAKCVKSVEADGGRVRVVVQLGFPGGSRRSHGAFAGTRGTGTSATGCRAPAGPER